MPWALKYLLRIETCNDSPLAKTDISQGLFMPSTQKDTPTYRCISFYLDQCWIPGNINLKHTVSLLFFEPGFLAWYFPPQTFQTLQTSYKHSDGGTVSQIFDLGPIISYQKTGNFYWFFFNYFFLNFINEKLKTKSEIWDTVPFIYTSSIIMTPRFQVPKCIFVRDIIFQKIMLKKHFFQFTVR